MTHRIKVKGKIAVGGKALGVIYEKQKKDISPSAETGHGEEERLRFYGAVSHVKEILEQVYRESEERVGREESEIFLIHGLILEDEDFLSAAEKALEKGHTAEYAVIAARDYAVDALRATEDPLLLSRCDDLFDLASRLISELTEGDGTVYPEEDFLYYATDLTPGEVMALDESRCVGILLRKGSLRSHAAILAGALSLPLLVEVGEFSAQEETPVLLDGETGEVILFPSDEEFEAFRLWQKEKEEEKKRQRVFRDVRFHYPSGRGLLISANAGSLEECERAREVGAEGVGLFRSEFLFMEREDAPSEEEQLSLYRRVLALASPHRAVIRTFDLGADKVPGWYPMAKEINPALGLRGVRLALCDPALFDPQLRALLRASLDGSLVILLPMVTSPDEVRAVRERLEALTKVLASEGHAVGQYSLGVMIETPAAALMAEELCEVSEYLSIGTNDLLQYTLAIDREHPALSHLADPRHPAMRRLIERTVNAAHEKGVAVGICGEIAGDTALTKELLTFGADTLSVSVSKVPAVKEAVAKHLASDGK